MPASLTSDRGERKNSFVKLWIIRVKWGLSVDSKPALAIRGCGLEGGRDNKRRLTTNRKPQGHLRPNREFSESPKATQKRQRQIRGPLPPQKVSGKTS